MFINRLYKFNKISCIIFIAFMLTFIYINYKWGIVATPILQNGMYSKPVYLKDTQTIYFVKANDKTIDCSKITLTERDILQVYPDYFEKQKINNQTVYNTMQKYVAAVSLTSFYDKEKFVNNIPDSIFANWFTLRVQKIIDEPVLTLNVFKQQFTYKNDELVAVDTLLKLNYFAP
jgi:hypothetical protein